MALRHLSFLMSPGRLKCVPATPGKELTKRGRRAPGQLSLAPLAQPSTDERLAANPPPRVPCASAATPAIARVYRRFGPARSPPSSLPPPRIRRAFHTPLPRPGTPCILPHFLARSGPPHSVGSDQGPPASASLPAASPEVPSTDALDEDEASDHEHRVPVKLGFSRVPAEPLAVVEDPDEGEDHGQEADQQRRHQQPQKAPVAFHGHQCPILRVAAAAGTRRGGSSPGILVSGRIAGVH
uniref:Uncharacterized protein n=1 Tax=Molossus molossus TaxID=27622 RepID=A0A7J8FSN1_MOLMO|nr:hypothetical protein HJG59_008397 [Molossus molossus]